MSDIATLTPEEIRSLLRECVTVVKPGETLVLRVPMDTSSGRILEIHKALNWGWDEGEPLLPFRTVVVPGDGLGVVEPESDAAFAQRVAKAQNQLAVQARFPTRRSHG